MRRKKLKGVEKSVRYNGSVPDGWHSLIENNLVALIGRDCKRLVTKNVYFFLTTFHLFLQYLLQLVQYKNYIRAYRMQRRHFHAVGDNRAPQSLSMCVFLEPLLTSNLINRFCQNLLKQCLP